MYLGRGVTFLQEKYYGYEGIMNTLNTDIILNIHNRFNQLVKNLTREPRNVV